MSECWGDGPVVAAFGAWAVLCGVFVAAGQLRSARRRALLFNPLLHQLQPQPPGPPLAAVLVRSKARTYIPGSYLCMCRSVPRGWLGAAAQHASLSAAFVRLHQMQPQPSGLLKAAIFARNHDASTLLRLLSRLGKLVVSRNPPAGLARHALLVLCGARAMGTTLVASSSAPPHLCPSSAFLVWTVCSAEGIHCFIHGLRCRAFFWSAGSAEGLAWAAGCSIPAAAARRQAAGRGP